MTVTPSLRLQEVKRGRRPHMHRRKQQHPQILGTRHTRGSPHGSSKSPYACDFTASQWTASEQDSCSEMSDRTARTRSLGVAKMNAADGAWDSDWSVASIQCVSQWHLSLCDILFPELNCCRYPWKQLQSLPWLMNFYTSTIHDHCIFINFFSPQPQNRHNPNKDKISKTPDKI